MDWGLPFIIGCRHGWPPSHFGSCSISWSPTAIMVAAYLQAEPTGWQRRTTAESIICWECELGHHAAELCWWVRSAAAHFFQTGNGISPKDMHKRMKLSIANGLNRLPLVGYLFQEWKTWYNQNTAHTRCRKAGALWLAKVLNSWVFWQLLKIGPFHESRSGNLYFYYSSTKGKNRASVNIWKSVTLCIFVNILIYIGLWSNIRQDDCFNKTTVLHSSEYNSSRKLLLILFYLSVWWNLSL